MFTVISRIVHYGFKNFWRNGWLSTVTVAIMVLALVVFNGLILFKYVANQAVASIESKIDLPVFFNSTASEDQILAVQQSLQSLSEVKSVQYVSRDQALATFEQAHANDTIVTQGISELTSNPLDASLNITANRPDQYNDIISYLNNPDIKSLLDPQAPVSDPKYQAVISRLDGIINNVNLGGWVLAVFLALVAGLVVFNTIRLAIYSNRDEIGVMRVVGASNSFVRGPSVVEGTISGVLASVISLALAAPIIYFVSPYFETLIPGLGLFHYFYSHIALLLLYQLIFGVGIGIFSSFIAVRRYLRN
ncbi:MAG TPA: permease-like cell division protein FtsX [Candidatus Paceibacterota bacterium]|nr:permease-like cell division protein FtsX [Candidatus Paceibacterota bacterium]